MASLVPTCHKNKVGFHVGDGVFHAGRLTLGHFAGHAATDNIEIEAGKHALKAGFEFGDVGIGGA